MHATELSLNGIERDLVLLQRMVGPVIALALEVVLGAALQLLGNRTQDHGPPPTTEVLMPPAGSTRGKHQNFATAP